MAEIYFLSGSSGLLQDIELGLKARLERFLQRRHGRQWWSTLPSVVQRNAGSRYKWAVSQIGRSKAGSEHDIAWLSMGDLAKAIAELDGPSWRECLQAQAGRRRVLEEAFTRVKFIRDSAFAHPKPRVPTNFELRNLYRGVIQIADAVRPQEWAATLVFLQEIRELSKDARNALASAVSSDIEGRTNSRDLERWMACPRLERFEVCRHKARLAEADAKWRAGVVGYCHSVNYGCDFFFGIEH